jgi:hypothetical protein
MNALQQTTSGLLLIGAVGMFLVFIKVMKLMPTRWLKLGLSLKLGAATVLMAQRAYALITGGNGHPSELLLLASYALGCIITTLAVFGYLNGYKPNRKR